MLWQDTDVSEEDHAAYIFREPSSHDSNNTVTARRREK
jgi:hypothetical protein